MSESKSRLNSWKEIGAYLGYDESTVRRWERCSHLPVHRVGGSRGASVYAYPEEIDDWLRKPANQAVTASLQENASSKSQFESTEHDPPLVMSAPPEASEDPRLSAQTVPLPEPSRSRYVPWRRGLAVGLFMSAITA